MYFMILERQGHELLCGVFYFIIGGLVLVGQRVKFDMKSLKNRVCHDLLHGTWSPY